jgi:hypothetical protein
VAEIWQTSVHQCVSIFRDSLIAMIPFAQRARMSWREPSSYDDWDRIATALFHSFVIDALAYARECSGWPPLIPYDHRVSTYTTSQSYLFDTVEGPLSPFVCLETCDGPFDTCLLARIDARGTTGVLFRKPFSAVNLHAIAGLGAAARADQLAVEL